MAFTKVQSGFIDLSVSSGLTVGAGSASTPAINFSDNSTGFFRPGSNEIGVALSGSQKFTFKNNNFGIGTNSPDVPLVVVGNTKISGNTHIGSPSGSAARLAVYKETQSSGSPVFEAYSNITNNAQTKIFVVDGDGEVGIGIGNPSALLHTQNNSGENQFRISSSQGSYRRIIFHDSHSNPTKYNFQIAVQEVDNSIHIGPSSAVGGLSFSGSNGIVVKSDAKVGIGNNNPAQLLTVGAITGGADGNLSVKTNSNTHAIAIEENNGNENYQLGVNSSGDLGFYNSGSTTPTVTFSDDGQVLIGTSSLIDTSVASNFQIASASGPRLCIARNDTDTDDGNLIGALDFYGNHTATAGGYELIGRMLCEADADHSDSSKPSRLSFYTCTSGTDAAVEKMRLNAAGELLIGETNSPLDDSITGATACKIGMSFGNSIGNYIEMGGTNRTANGLNKLATMRHGYWGGAREVGSLGFLTSSSSGGAGRGSANFVIHTGTSGNGDGGVSGDTLSIERVRVDSGGALYVNTTSNSNWGQTSNSLNTDNSNTNDISGNMCFRSYSGALIIANDADAGYSAIYINKFDWDSGDDNRWINFYLNGAGMDSISWNGSNIVYGQGSDYRIKTNIRDFTGGIDLVKQLPVRLYDYIETERGTDHVGFIAHELQEIIPEAVSGEKDGMRAEEDTGEEVMNIQTVEYGKVTPLLTAALKEAISKIETLEARLEAAGI